MLQLHHVMNGARELKEQANSALSTEVRKGLVQHLFLCAHGLSAYSCFPQSQHLIGALFLHPPKLT